MFLHLFPRLYFDTAWEGCIMYLWHSQVENIAYINEKLDHIPSSYLNVPQ